MIYKTNDRIIKIRFFTKLFTAQLWCRK